MDLEVFINYQETEGILGVQGRLLVGHLMKSNKNPSPCINLLDIIQAGKKQ